jgi:putative flippase GtrA
MARLAVDNTSFGARLQRHYRRMPETMRMVVTALVGALIGLVTYEIVYALNPFEPRATSSWLLAFAIGVSRQHSLHRWLTFDHESPYWRSLGRAYLMYSGTAVVGTALNWLLTEEFALNHRLAWLICLVNTALISLLFLRRFVFAPRL